MKSKYLKISVVLAIILLVFASIKFDLTSYLTLDSIKDNKQAFEDYYQSNKTQSIFIFFSTYVLTTALSLPGATVLTLLAGALFGLYKGLIIVSFASSIGATLAFLISRFLLRDWVQEKYGQKLKTINEGIEREGAFYLLTLRLLPIFPFFLINLVMGLTPIKTITFFFTSQIGMLLGTIVYVNAGVELSEIDSLKSILSPSLLFSFVALGLIPIIGKKIVNYLREQKVYKDFKKPSKFDYNMVAIGAGAAGLVTSYIGAMTRAKVALIEKHKMGGDCLNTGCVPSKALIKTAKVIHQAKNAKDYGIDEIMVSYTFSTVMDRVKDVIKKIEPHDSIDRYSKLGVNCYTSHAKIVSPWEIEIDGEVITTKNITIATGAKPFIPNIKGIREASIITSDTLWSLQELPNTLVVLGAGPIGIELAQAFSRLGSEVTIVEIAERILIKEDLEVSNIIEQSLKKEGIKILTNHKAIQFIKNGSESLVTSNNGKEFSIDFDKALIAVGRKANTEGLGLNELGVILNDNGSVKTNEYLQTNFPNIFACGDVAGNFQLTHTAAHEAWYCAVNGLFGNFKKFKVDYSVIPWATYCDPEVATVGKNEISCQKEDIPYEVTRYGIDDLDRAIADSEAKGFVKVLTSPDSDKILGATIVAQNASEILIEFISAMKNGHGLNKILSTIHPYPTMGEANKYTAGEWKKSKKPEKLLKFVEKYHSWIRG